MSASTFTGLVVLTWEHRSESLLLSHPVTVCIPSGRDTVSIVHLLSCSPPMQDKLRIKVFSKIKIYSFNKITYTFAHLDIFKPDLCNCFL